MNDNQHTDGKIKANNNHEHLHFLNLIRQEECVDAKIIVHAKIIGDGMDLHKCSNCGHILPYDVTDDIIDFWKCNYCPCCGSKLEGD